MKKNLVQCLPFFEECLVCRVFMSHMAVPFVDIAAEDIAPGSRGAFGLLICEIRRGL